MLFLIDRLGAADAGRAFQGYYGNSGATQKKIIQDVLEKGDSYFRTGDIIRAQHDGFRRYTYFEDRIGDTFRWKGENVSTMVRFGIVSTGLIFLGGSRDYWCIPWCRRRECLRNTPP
jgi:AMP-binding enzyme